MIPKVAPYGIALKTIDDGQKDVFAAGALRSVTLLAGCRSHSSVLKLEMVRVRAPVVEAQSLLAESANAQRVSRSKLCLSKVLATLRCLQP